MNGRNRSISFVLHILPKPELITQHMATGKTDPAEDFLFNKEQIESFDQFVILLKNTVSQMVYKHAISTVVPSRPVSHHSNNAGGGTSSNYHHGSSAQNTSAQQDSEETE